MTTFDHIARSARSRRICKDPANGLIFGVCAGIAWWLGIKDWAVRAAAILLLLLWTGPALVAYLLAALLLGNRPYDRYEDFVRRYGDDLGRPADDRSGHRGWR